MPDVSTKYGVDAGVVEQRDGRWVQEFAGMDLCSVIAACWRCTLVHGQGSMGFVPTRCFSLVSSFQSSEVGLFRLASTPSCDGSSSGLGVLGDILLLSLVVASTMTEKSQRLQPRVAQKIPRLSYNFFLSRFCYVSRSGQLFPMYPSSVFLCLYLVSIRFR